VRTNSSTKFVRNLPLRRVSRPMGIHRIHCALQGKMKANLLNQDQRLLSDFLAFCELSSLPMPRSSAEGAAAVSRAKAVPDDIAPPRSR
jgi:hypothetical protein